MSALSNTGLALLPLVPCAYLFHLIEDVAIKRQLIISIAIGISAYGMTAYLVPIIAEYVHLIVCLSQYTP